MIYLIKAYKVALKEGKHEFCSKIAFDIAKVETRNLSFKKAKYRLDESIENSTSSIESYLLKARICKSLLQKEEFETLINIIYQKIVNQDKEFSLSVNYKDILKYIYAPTNNLVEKEIAQ